MSLNLEIPTTGSKPRRILFSSDRNCIVGLTENGYNIFNCCPVISLLSKNLCQYGFCSADIYKRSNILILSGNDKSTKYTSNTVYIFNGQTDNVIASIELAMPVQQCYIKNEFILIVVHNCTYIYNFGDVTLYSQYVTYFNPKGLCDVQIHDELPIVAVLGERKGSVTLWRKNKKTLGNTSLTINAHESDISFFRLSSDGGLLATASVRGSMIRIFNTYNGILVSALRRGRTHANVINLEFDKNMQYFLCNTDTTIHIAKRITSRFSNKASTTSLSSIIKSESTSSIKDSTLFFSDTFSMRYSNPDGSKTMVAVFGPEPDTIYVCTSKGLLQKLSIDGDSWIMKYRDDLISS